MARAILTAALLGLGILTIPSPGGALAQGLVPCAREGGYCRVPYPTRVIYGARGRNAAVEVRGRGIPCNNDVFGDPAIGLPKACFYVARGGGGGGYDEDEGGGPSWRTCARENGYCDFNGRKRVRYGVRGRFVEGVYRNGVDCDNDTFGDPVPGVPKVCQVLD